MITYCRWLKDVGLGDLATVGGKNASLGEMIRELQANEIRVPDGFAITADAYRQFMKDSGLNNFIIDTLQGLDSSDISSLERAGSKIRTAILNADLPENLVNSVIEFYQEMSHENGPVSVAIRSSATAEDLPTASFAGQQETYLNVKGESELLDHIRRCYASLYTNRAISYRENNNFDHSKVALSVGVQRMIRSDLASSGVIFTIDTETGFKNAVVITGAWGLGENIVQGTVNPDEFIVFKPTLDEYQPIIRKKCGSKEMKMVYAKGGTKRIKNIPTKREQRKSFVLSDEEILKLAKWSVRIEEHYSKKYGHETAMDIEWGKDGETGELYILQARPETVQSQKPNYFEIYKLEEKGDIICRGASIGDKIVSGVVHVINSIEDLKYFKEGEILVTKRTDPDWGPSMKKARAIITDTGGRTCHAAIVSRELGVAAIVGTNDATSLLQSGDVVTLDCASSDVGTVYKGELRITKENVELNIKRRPKTKIMLNIADPSQVFSLSRLPQDGVGLARLEFIINNHVKVHPMALIQFDQLESLALKRKIENLTYGYDIKTDYFVDQLAQSVSMLTAAFWPNDVIVRMSDFKTNEYAKLLGGAQFEPHEENPMIGFRGASRYYHKSYRQGFALECQAMDKVRRKMGLKNLKLMIPFCRTLEEAQKVLDEMKLYGLERGRDGLEIYVMCEIPSNVICASEFAELFDGFSIGSNDLTQLTLGVDRDNELLKELFDENNLAVKRMIEKVIRDAHEGGAKVGLCGQAPSDNPEFARFLIQSGIDSISLTADALLKVTQLAMKMDD
ncbi:phosphoenolpyruvate synthase [Halobacteriovorax sp. GFR7]|uniref:phosphoenolpyruvate synthase n=1 Tax=unclassified Halobacteriovorax TaxID=2639665 RepID=UPI003D974661